MEEYRVSGEGRTLRAVGKAALHMLAALSVLGLAVPAQAQFSAGYKFLEAVRKSDGNTVEEALNKPGSTIVNTRDSSTGETALHIVTKRRDRVWMSYMLSKGANVNARDRDGTTPLQIAANLGFAEGVELLIQYRADTAQANDAGETALITAVHRHDLAMSKLLLAGGADPERPDNSGRSAREYAKLESQEQILAAFDAAAKKGKPAAAKPVYGPSF